MRLLEKGRTIEDRFIRLADDEPLPDGAPDSLLVLVSADRLLKADGDVVGRAAAVGVIWPNNRRIEEIAPLLPNLALVALVFPTFRDGRAYSQARLLRERLGWRGPLRATGQVLRDQFLFMLRAGFDQLEVRKDADADAFAAEAQSYSVFYQPTGDGRPSLLRSRLGRTAAAKAESVT